MSTGYKQGKEEGIEQGIEKGEFQEKQRVLIRLLNGKFEISDSDKELILSVDDPERLDNFLKQNSICR